MLIDNSNCSFFGKVLHGICFGIFMTTYANLFFFLKLFLFPCAGAFYNVKTVNFQRYGCQCMVLVSPS